MTDSNLYTEAEAGKKDCRAISPTQILQPNETGDGLHSAMAFAMCRSSHCMMWRWSSDRLGEIIERKPADANKTAPGPEWERRSVEYGVPERQEFVRRAPSMKQGYCGLAGRPLE